MVKKLTRAARDAGTCGTVHPAGGRYSKVMGRTRSPFGRSMLIACSLGTLALSGSPDARADGFAPGLSLGTRYDQPASGVAGTGGEWFGTLTPLVLYERLGPYTNWDLRGSRRYDTDPNVSGLHHANDVVQGRLDTRWSEQSHAMFDGSYFYSRDIFNPDPLAAFSPTTQSRGSASAGVETYRLEGDIHYEDTRYSDPGYEDGTALAWGAGLFPIRSEMQRWAVSFRREELTLGGQTELATSTATAGLRRQNTSTLATRVEAGAVWITEDLDGGAREDFAWVAGVEGFGPPLHLPFDGRLEVRHDVTTAGVAEIWRSIPGRRLGLLWERDLDAKGGFFNEATFQDYVAFDVQDTLGGRSILSIEASYRRARPRSQPGERLETYRLGAGLSRDLQPWLRGRARYSLAHQRASAGINGYDFDRNRVELMLTAVYQ